MNNFEELERRLSQLPTKNIAVAAAEDVAVLKSVEEAQKRKIVTPLLCGDEKRILQISNEHGIDISDCKIIHADTSKEAAQKAVELVRNKEADMLMKGFLQTADLLRAVLNKESGLRKNAIISHVSIVSSPVLKRLFLLTDAAMVMYPDLTAKIGLIRNAVEAAKGMGIDCPKVAPLAAVELVNPEMAATTDAALLTQMNYRGQISDCIIDGPLAMDIAISEEAAHHKGIKSSVAGKADILLFHNIEAANSTLKTFTVAGDCLLGGVVMGASVPIVLTSRSDSEKSKLFSIMCAAAISSAE